MEIKFAWILKSGAIYAALLATRQWKNGGRFEFNGSPRIKRWLDGSSNPWWEKGVLAYRAGW